MTITIEYLSRRENDNDQSVEFNITDEANQKYRFRADIPKDISEEDIPTYIDTDSFKEMCMLSIRMKEYGHDGAFHYETDDVTNDTDYKKMKKWILNGANLYKGKDKDDKKLWVPKVDKEKIESKVV